MSQVVELGSGRDGWLRRAAVRQLLQIGEWFADAGSLAADPGIFELANHIHRHIALLAHYTERCIYSLDIGAEGHNDLLKMLRRLRADRGDPAWPSVVALAVLHVSHPDGILHYVVPEISVLAARPIHKPDSLFDALAALDGDQIEGLAGTLIGTLHFALLDAWDPAGHVRQPELQNIGPQPLPAPFSLPPFSDRHLTDQDGTELVGFTDAEDFPNGMNMVDCSTVVPTIVSTTGCDTWEELAGGFLDNDQPACVLNEPLRRRVCIMVLHHDGFGELDAIDATASYVRVPRTLVQFTISAHPAERRIGIDIEAMVTTATMDQGEMVATAALMSYWHQVIHEMDQLAAPGEVVTLNLIPHRSSYDGFLMNIEAHLVESIMDRDVTDGRIHGFLVDVHRCDHGEKDPLPLLGQHVAPPAVADDWRTLEDDLAEMLHSSEVTDGIVTLTYEYGFLSVSHGRNDTEFDCETTTGNVESALERLVQPAIMDLLEDFMRRYCLSEHLAVIHMEGRGTFIMPLQRRLDDEWTRDHQVIAHYRHHPKLVEERNGARRFWMALHPNLEDIL